MATDKAARPRLGLIGHGAIGQAITSRLRAEGGISELAAILVRPGKSLESGLPFRDSLEAFLEAQPEVVIEAAGHGAVAAFGPEIVKRECRLIISSVGALADDNVAERLRAADPSGQLAIVPAGAIAGLDGLVAARIAGLREVTYSSLKPPAAWRGTAAEDTIDLNHREEELVFFDDSARQAALRYPKNANVSAAIAIAGLGLEKTRVRLVSSRRVSNPLGIIEASGDFGWFRFEIFANAFPENPKTSMLTAFSLLQCARYGIGIPAL